MTLMFIKGVIIVIFGCLRALNILKISAVSINPSHLKEAGKGALTQHQLSDPDLLPVCVAALVFGLWDERRRTLLGEPALLSQTLLTGVQLSQQTVLLQHPALLVSSTLKLQLQEVPGAVVQQVLRALQSAHGTQSRSSLALGVCWIRTRSELTCLWGPWFCRGHAGAVPVSPPDECVCPPAAPPPVL